MLKRARMPRWDGGGYVGPDDFKIGSTFRFLGRNVKIYSCDPFTKEYYDRIGKPQDMSLEEAVPPVDNFRYFVICPASGQVFSLRRVWGRISVGAVGTDHVGVYDLHRARAVGRYISS